MRLPFISENRTKLSRGQNDRQELTEAAQTDSAEEQAILGLSELYVPEESRNDHAYDIADVLLEIGKLTDEEYGSLRKEQAAKPGMDAATLLIKGGRISSNDLLMANAKLYGMEFKHIEPKDVDRNAFEMLDTDFIKETNICPVRIEEDTLIAATSEPANVFAIEDAKRRVQMDLQLIVCPQEDINAVCESFKQECDYCVDEIISDMADVEVVQDQQEESEDLEKMAGQSPVIKFVNYLISNAIREGASDIHIEPKDKVMKVRYRIDGVLFENTQSPLKMHSAVVSRVKIMANLDISERRLPQDGKISVIVGGREIDLRVSILPTNHGEKVVIRILDSKSILRGLEQLGMDPEVMTTFRDQILLPHGILLVTGPTGSGKSTTLYSALCQMDGEKLNISTVEDPVEYELDFCSQVQAKEKIGLTFSSALRSLLRQDPDIIMIGEIRDGETAKIAVQAALTGHLVLSTLHTNDAPSSITRLVNIGIDSYLIAASLNAVLAQRLVRKICPKCKQAYKLPDNMRRYFERSGECPQELYHGVGCDNCRNSGYLGRVGIYELLVIDDAFRDIINKDPSVSNMRQTFYGSGEASLFDDGIKKVKQGLTTISEVLRVTEMYGKSESDDFVENIDIRDAEPAVKVDEQITHQQENAVSSNPDSDGNTTENNESNK